MEVKSQDVCNELGGYFLQGTHFGIKRVKSLHDGEPDFIEEKLDKLFEFNRHFQVLSILNENKKELLEKLDAHRKETICSGQLILGTVLESLYLTSGSFGAKRAL